VEDGMRRMYFEQENIFYYLTIGNENHAQPAAPEHLSREELKDGILRGLYLFRRAEGEGHRVQLFGSGAIMFQVLEAQELLKEYGVAADVWSATSYKQLHVDALDTERWNRLHPEAEQRVPYVQEVLNDTEGPIVAASDYIKLLPQALTGFMPRSFTVLGTDGFGRSEGREELRDFFEVDARHITVAALSALADEGTVDTALVSRAISDLGINPGKPNPRVS